MRVPTAPNDRVGISIRQFIRCTCLLAAGAADAEARPLRAVAVGPPDLPRAPGAAADGEDAAQLRRSCCGIGSGIFVLDLPPLGRSAARVLFFVLQSRPPVPQNIASLTGARSVLWWTRSSVQHSGASQNLEPSGSHQDHVAAG